MSTSGSTKSTRITILISGSGTNLQALIDACGTSTLPNASIIRVISNRKNAYGLQRAQNAGIPTLYHNLVSYKKELPDEGQAREKYDKDLADKVLQGKPDLVVCAGWMHILAPTFLDPLTKADVPIINLHPALPGQFNGAKAIERAFEASEQGKVDKTGVMIHYVISEVDMGEPILVREIDIKKDDSLESLEQRIHENEWQVIVEGTKLAITALHQKHTETDAT